MTTEKKNPVQTRPFPVMKETRLVPEVTKPVPSLKETTQSTRPLVEPAQAAATEGMQAHRREIEKRKREAARERLHQEEDSREGWVRVWKLVGLIVTLLAVSYAYWRVQMIYGNSWPLMAVWIVMASALLIGIFGMLWYVGKQDL